MYAQSSGILQGKVLQNKIYNLSDRDKTLAVSHDSWSGADLARKIRNSVFPYVSGFDLSLPLRCSQLCDFC